MAVKKKNNKNKSNKKNNYNKKNTVKKNSSKKKNYNKNKSNKKNYNNKKNVKKKNNVSNKVVDEIFNKDLVNDTIDSNSIGIDSSIVDEFDKSSDVDLCNDSEIELVSETILNNDINSDLNIDNGIKDINSDLNIDNGIKDSVNNKIDIGNIDNLCNKKNYMNILFILIFIIVLVFGVMYFPKIELCGASEMVISYKDKYVEPGYKMKLINNDVSNEINVDGNVIDGEVGEYELNYSIDLFGIKFYKKRRVIVVDNDSPVISVDSNVINVCPNGEVFDFEYSAIDEYDGDITSRVEKIINDDEIILNVTDNSGNKISKKILVDRVDSVSPVINLKGNSVMFLEYGDKYVEPGYIVSDNCSNNLNSKVKISGSVGRDIGTYTLKYEIVDDNGNKGSISRTVIIGTKVSDNGSVNNGSIYLTFDDGPNDGTTNKILDILKEEGVRATFFVTCNGSDSLIKRIYDEGHTVALHTASHNYSNIYSSVDNYFSDLNKVSERVKRITGVDSKIIRFPGGSSNVVSKNYKVGIMSELTNLVLNYGYRYYDWNVDAMDASSAKNSSDVYYNVTSNLNMNRANMVLMHDTKSITVFALRDIIRFGKNNGYSFEKIDMNTKMVRHNVNN